MTPMAFPQTAEITHVVRNIVTDPARFLGRVFCPMRDVFAAQIEFDVLAAAQGMTPAHNLGSDPKMAKLPGMKTKKIGTGYWKETKRINEAELLNARMAGTYNQRAGRLLVVEKANMLNSRLETRIEWLIWQAVTGGQIQIDENGVKYTVLYDIPAKNKVTLAAGDKWSNADADIPSIITAWMLLYRGTGARPIKMYFNLKVAGYIAANNKIKELLKNTVYASFLSAANITQALKLLFPKIDFVIYDEGYVDETDNFHSFIPDDHVVMIGEGQPGELMMDFGTTISLHNGGLEQPQPGKFSIIDDKSEQEKNPYLDVTVGIYGLPRVYHPNWIVTAKID